MLATKDERDGSIAYVEVLGVDLAMLREVEVLLCNKYALYVRISFAIPTTASQRSLESRAGVYIPRKRYSWIFLRSALGMSLEESLAGV